MSMDTKDTNGHWVTRRTGIVPSAPPSTRFSKRTVLDEAGRPTTPEPAAEVTFTAHGILVGRHLVEVHDHYRGELRELHGLLERVAQGVITAGQARGELNEFALRANNWAFGGLCQRQCVAFVEHHLSESGSVFPYLGRRQRSLQGVLDRLEAEHHVIGEVLEGVDAALVHLARNPTELDPITEAVDLLTDTMLSHFAYEERELIAPLAQYGFFPGQLS
ncbi:MAG: hemerythrin domain-containing protein [Jatrophihabitantaceae bacterium]